MLGKEGVIPHLVAMLGPAGHPFLNETQMGDAFEHRLGSVRNSIEVYDAESHASSCPEVGS